jgi:hypothetical protein
LLSSMRSGLFGCLGSSFGRYLFFDETV